MLRRGFSYGGGGGAPGGLDTYVQYNAAGAFAGDAGFTYDATNKTLNIGGGTVTASDPVLDLSQTWNNAGVTFDALKVTITKTAAGGSSRGLNINVGGRYLYWVPDTVAGNDYMSLSGAGIGINNGYGFTFGSPAVGGNSNSYVGYFGLISNSTGNIGFAASGNGTNSGDVLMARDAAGVLALRNSTNAQTFRVYNTTDAGLTNYERLAFNAGAAGDWFQIAAETGGTGVDNIGLAFTPAGTGAIAAHVPDSAVAGGNARGLYATDWQRLRTAATQVASGDRSTIAGGSNNTASSYRSFVGGGFNNASSGQNSAVSGGTSNVASGNDSSVGGGQSNTASGHQSTASGGYGNSATGLGATVSGGGFNVASGIRSWIPGGSRATTRDIAYAGAYGMPYRAATGDRQTMVLPVSCAATTDATPTRLTSDAAAASTTNQMILPNNSSVFFEVDVVAHDASLKSASWKVQGTARRGANAAATVIVGTNITTVFDSDLPGGSPGVTVTADTVNGGLAVTFTGIAATTIYPVGHIRVTQAA